MENIKNLLLIFENEMIYENGERFYPQSKF